MSRIIFALLAIVLAGSHVVLAANRMPEFDPGPSCRAATAASAMVNRTEDVCKRDETDARGKLQEQWGQFAAGHKARCVGLSKAGGAPSYVELLTCLEMAKAADNLPAQDRLVGQRVR